MNLPPPRRENDSTPAGVTPLTAGDPRVVGALRVVGRLGTGGMGTVYAALDDHDRRVALKRVHPMYAADEDFRIRFAREVKLVRRIRVPGVPRFLDADTRADVPWLATEYVPGPTLEAHVRGAGPLTGTALAGFARVTAEALAAIHAAGVVHRDLKPGNVILSPDGPKVLDFGIARAAEETALTRTGGLVGTPGWIAPEQYRGLSATDRSDMFAWACLVVFAATGRGPFGVGTADVIAGRILSAPPSLEGVPDALRPLLAHALDKDPGRRPAAAEAAGALPVAVTPWGGAFLPEDTDPEAWLRAAPPRRPWRRRHGRVLTLAAVATALAVAVGAGSTLLPLDDTPPPSEVPPSDGGDVPTTDAAALAEVPEEYRDLYENGTVVIEPASDTEPVVVRSLVASEGREAVEQLRVTFTGSSQHSGTLRVDVRVEYLPDFGSLRLHSQDFAWVQAIEPDHEYLDLRRSTSPGVLAELDPEDPTEEFPVTFFGSPPGVVYYLPEAALDEDRRAPLDQPGGFCHGSPEPGIHDPYPGHPDLGRHDATLTDGVPVNSCAYVVP
ncbi:serine/threonine-protein kinase [Nocardiopsis lambiniae]|uniref:Serine/threonine-protein kinase n=1 Tax=Nocardiopsis lambiniae TaxID=3075539 RepID=A0ABU2M915_9ACTN|nr:serine/threonine-protein kinase [Nocardiopsis sp. DSM 44743]MDT0329162.1 serine/threonine-protein kinase [Nocardiopsis sp. DSM 44743]